MPLTMGGAGVLGVAFEAVYGTFVPPTKFIPIRSESLTHNEDKQVLTPIRGLAVASKVKRGYTVVEGDIEFEVTSDTLIYFLYAARTTPSRVGVAAPFTYNFVPSSVVQPTTAAGEATRKTLSVYIDRGGEEFTYVGCSVGQISFTIDNGDLICTASVVGLDLETDNGATVPAYDAWEPFGPGQIGVELPTGTPRTDMDTFTINIQDNAEALNRIKQGSRSPTYVRWGEREVSGTFDHDFLNLSEYNAFINNTSREWTILATHDANNDQVEITLRGTLLTGYPVNLSSLSDLIRASVDFRSVYNGAPEYEIEVKTNEDVTA